MKNIGWASLLVLIIAVSRSVRSSDGTQVAKDIDILNPDTPLKVSFDEQAVTLSEGDNPVVFQYHFKKDLMKVLKRKLAR